MAVTILAINPGSTSTKCAVYRDADEVWKKGLVHRAEELARFRRIQDQFAFRAGAVRDSLKEAAAVSLSSVDAVVGRGGLLKPLPGGVYEVNEAMKSDLVSCRYGTHASNLGALIADSIAAELGVKAYIVDPVVVDERAPIARLSGVPEIPRRSIFHALNQKATARKAARGMGKPYDACLFVVAHMGGGTSVGLHAHGRVVDVNNALDGDGPFAIERAGTVPAGDWMRYVLSHQHDPEALQKMITGRGGLVAYLGTNDFPAIESAAQGSQPADLPRGPTAVARRRAGAGRADMRAAHRGDVLPGGQVDHGARGLDGRKAGRRGSHGRARLLAEGRGRDLAPGQLSRAGARVSRRERAGGARRGRA